MASESGKAKTIQIFHYLKRNPNFKREEFWEYWTRVHGPKIVPLAEKYGFQRYQQVGALLYSPIYISTLLLSGSITYAMFRGPAPHIRSCRIQLLSRMRSERGISQEWRRNHRAGGI